MKLVVGVVTPSSLSAVKAAVLELGASGMTVSEAHGLGHEPGHAEIYRGATFEVDFVPRLRVEVLVDDDDAGVLAGAMADAARSDHAAHGLVWILPVQTAVRVLAEELALR